MFRKPYKVKTNTQLKSSERKKAIQKVQTHLSLSEDDVHNIFPAKEPISAIRVILTSQDVVTVYACQEVPLFFEHEENVYPTVYLLWRHPTVVPCIRVHCDVLSHLLNGADLMIPGVISEQDHLKEANFPTGTLVYINTDKNIAAACVGISLVTSSDMVLPGNKGKCVRVVHFVGDELSKMYEGGKEIPDLGVSFETTQPVEQGQVVEAVESISEEKSEKSEQADINLTMNELLIYCFTKSLVKSSSELPLPILTNIFYKNYMLPTVPKDMNLDLKKTSYKKLSVFLSKMSESNIVCLETAKGVQSLISVNYNHDIFKNFVDHFKSEDELAKKEENSPQGMLINEKNVVNNQIEGIFSKYKLKKGHALTDQEVRQYLTQYIKDENLQDPNDKMRVTLNGPLCDILRTKTSSLTWKDLFDDFIKKMSKCYEVRTPNDEVISGKGKLPPVELSVAVKTSNKKVTIVKNLELYGINMNDFSKECQHGVAASSTISTLPNSKSAQFQIQGNQKKFIGELLQRKYLIPKKYIEGLEEQKSKKR